MNECQFSIVIPLFNREVEIVRALTSCLREMDENFEIIVVDDASSDGSLAAVKSFLGDPRIKLIINETNKGEWGARAAGVAKAQGEWIIWLDSDDEFLPGGLSLIKAAIHEHGTTFHRLGFEYVYDSGGNSPSPKASEPTILDLDGYVRWYADIERSDALWVTKRETFGVIPVPEGRSGHLLYAFGFNSTYRTLLLPIPTGTVHTDSGNRLSSATPSYNTAERDKAESRRSECDALLEKYGSHMLRVSRRAHRRLSRNRVFSAIVAGRRLAALKCLLFHLRHHPSVEIVLLSLLIVAGPRLTQFVNSYRRQWLLQKQAAGLS
jgi:Glycosyl transferase family 2